MSQEEFVKSMANIWGMSEEEKETAIKKARIDDLLLEVDIIPFGQFFDSDSDKMLDEKIEVLTKLKEGKKISEIPQFYDILELYPKEQEQEGVIINTHWD